MSSHTPGPWQVGRETSDGQTWTDHEIYGKPGIVAHLGKHKRYAEGIKAQEADARLIAAAPQLMDACVDASDLLDDFIEGEPIDHTKLQRVWETIERAIAAADGRNE